ncbi:DUF2332 domain-containing protein [Nitratireductor thuwali]|uniref:DUF2332 domain-containing protein n=1 Tax=Nitratireductor thuwali TaxID=2267699 RepID=A0ABY5MLA2_9HYPH|nr:hypothetical protein NTH_01878 [Nitratireductor thuwali]
MSIRQHFLRQAKACDELGSPFTARLCRLLPSLLDQTAEVGGIVTGWGGNAGADALALRFCGGLHALVLSDRAPALAASYPPNVTNDEELARAIVAATLNELAFLVEFLKRPPQTNEIGRSAMLLPGLLAVGRETAMPIQLCEIGASAGLNLMLDRFHYRYGKTCWGDEAAPVRLAPEIRGKGPPLGGFLDISDRRGCDTAPIDIADAEERLRLRSYIWADQTERLDRLDAALALATQDPPPVETSDAADFVEKMLARRDPSSAFVLFHSIMWQYVPEATQRRIEKCLDTAGNLPGAAPIAWLRMEPVASGAPYATLRLNLWPGGAARDLAHCNYHGRWIEWIER